MRRNEGRWTWKADLRAVLTDPADGPGSQSVLNRDRAWDYLALLRANHVAGTRRRERSAILMVVVFLFVELVANADLKEVTVLGAKISDPYLLIRAGFVVFSLLTAVVCRCMYAQFAVEVRTSYVLKLLGMKESVRSDHAVGLYPETLMSPPVNLHPGSKADGVPVLSSLIYTFAGLALPFAAAGRLGYLVASDTPFDRSSGTVLAVGSVLLLGAIADIVALGVSLLSSEEVNRGAEEIFGAKITAMSDAQLAKLAKSRWPFGGVARTEQRRRLRLTATANRTSSIAGGREGHVSPSGE